MAEEIHVTGLADLNKFLQELPVKMEKNVMRGAMRAGAKVILDAAKANVHSVSGELAKGLKVSVRIRGGVVIASIKTTGEHSYVAHWVEFGTAAHWISVQKSERPSRMTWRGVRAFSIGTLNRMAKRGSLKIGTNFIGASVAHPGARPKPFMRPALDARAQDAVIAVGEYIKKRLATKYGLDTSDVLIAGDD